MPRTRHLARRLLPTLPEPVRRHLTTGRLLTADLLLIGVLAGLGCWQAFLASPAQSTSTATAIGPVQTDVVDPFRSKGGNGRVWLTDAALVRVDHLPDGTSGTRILFEAPRNLQVGQHLNVHVGRDGEQVRDGDLPGPAVLPEGQGAVLLIASISLIPLLRRWRRTRRHPAGQRTVDQNLASMRPSAMKPPTTKATARHA